MIRCTFCDNSDPSGTSFCTKCGAELPAASGDDTKAAVDQLEALIREGRKIEAIKLFRTRTGAGLKEAKDAVEAIERGEPLPPNSQPQASGFEGELLPLLRAGNKIEAIKRHRERTGASLSESKQAVEALAVDHGIPSQAGGCAGALLTVVVVLPVIINAAL